MTDIKTTLSGLLRIEGVRAAVIVSRDGFIIEGVTNDNDINMEAIGAVISTGVGSTESMGKELKVGRLGTSMVEYDNGIVMISLIGTEAILTVTADLKANLGNIRYQVKKIAVEVAGAL